MNERIRALRPYPMVELARRKQALVDAGHTVLDFGTGDPVEPTAESIRTAMREAVPEISQYPSVQGVRELREAAAGFFTRRFAVELDPETELLPTRGSKEAMFHLPLVLIDPATERRGVVYPVPGYPVMEIGSLYAHAETHPVTLDAGNGYLMDPSRIPAEVLERAAIVWINYPHNPTGTDLPLELWEAWIAAREEHGFVLCSDECYTELYFGERPRSVLEFGRSGCLAFHSLSKRSGMTGYRSGMIAGDAELIALYKKCRAAMGQALPIMEQRASITAWSDEEHVEARREVFGRKRDLVRTGLEQLGLEIWPATSTFYLWVRAPGDDGDAYASALLDRAIVVSPGSMFGEGNAAFVRLALVPDLAGCEEALARWREL